MAEIVSVEAEPRVRRPLRPWLDVGQTLAQWLASLEDEPPPGEDMLPMTAPHAAAMLYSAGALEHRYRDQRAEVGFDLPVVFRLLDEHGVKVTGRLSPDVFVALGVEHDPARREYDATVLKPPDFVLEVLSESTWERDMGPSWTPTRWWACASASYSIPPGSTFHRRRCAASHCRRPERGRCRRWRSRKGRAVCTARGWTWWRTSRPHTAKAKAGCIRCACTTRGHARTCAASRRRWKPVTRRRPRGRPQNRRPPLSNSETANSNAERPNSNAERPILSGETLNSNGATGSSKRWYANFVPLVALD